MFLVLLLPALGRRRRRGACGGRRRRRRRGAGRRQRQRRGGRAVEAGRRRGPFLPPSWTYCCVCAVCSSFPSRSRRCCRSSVPFGRQHQTADHAGDEIPRLPAERERGRPSRRRRNRWNRGVPPPPNSDDKLSGSGPIISPHRGVRVVSRRPGRDTRPITTVRAKRGAVWYVFPILSANPNSCPTQWGMTADGPTDSRQ